MSWPPLSEEVAAALLRLEDATTFKGLESDYEIVSRESIRRSWPALFAMLPGAALFAVIYGGAQVMGWLRPPDFVANAGWLLIIPAAAVGANLLRGVQAVKDEQRIGQALRRWRFEILKRSRSRRDAA